MQKKWNQQLIALLTANTVFWRRKPATLLFFGYLFYMIIGTILLSFSFSQVEPIAFIDNLFMAVSAVSTTGLVTVDPGTGYTFWGQFIIISLIQIGGIGFMTLSSFLILATRMKLGALRCKITQEAFHLPRDFKPTSFVLTVVIYTLVIEILGALALWYFFAKEGLDNALWLAIFHSISAFCTAGFSLFSTSFEAFSGHAGINFVVSLICILGALGFLVIVDIWRAMTGATKHLSFTTKVALKVTTAFMVIGTILLFVVPSSMNDLEPSERLLTAFFQTMTASTTVGFNTYPIDYLPYAAILFIFLLMIVGGSPAGTGGGLKSTTFATLLGLVRSILKERREITFYNRPLSKDRIQIATTSFIYFFILLSTALFFLFLIDSHIPFEVMLFEAISAMGTVGLSMGATDELSSLAKIVICILMFAGRVGILSFGIAISLREETVAEQKDSALVL